MSTGAALVYRPLFPALTPWYLSTTSPPMDAATSAVSITIRRAAGLRPPARRVVLPVTGAATRCGTTLISTGPKSDTPIAMPASHQPTGSLSPGVRAMASAAAAAPATAAMTTLARSTSQAS